MLECANNGVTQSVLTKAHQAGIIFAFAHFSFQLYL